MGNLSADFTVEVSQVTPASMEDSYQSISVMMPLDSYSTQSSSNSQVAENNFLTDFSSVKNKKDLIRRVKEYILRKVLYGL